MILAVDDNIAFHKQNLEDNKDHYTVFARATFGQAVKWAQQAKAGTKCHFNEIKVKKEEYLNLVDPEDLVNLENDMNKD